MYLRLVYLYIPLQVMRKLLIIIFIFSIIFSYYFKLFDRFTFFLIQERQQGFLHYKIARNIESNSEGDTIKNLNECYKILKEDESLIEIKGYRHLSVFQLI